MTFFTFLKLAFSKLVRFFVQTLPYIKRYIREILLVLITLLYLNAKSDYSAIVSELEAFKAKQAQLVAEKKKEAELLRKSAEIQHKNSYERYKQEIESRDLDRDKLKGSLTNEKNRIASLLNDIRVYQNRASGDGLSEAESPACPSPEKWADSNRTFAEVIKACQLTTVDYNTLRDAWDIECSIKGCEQ